MLMMILLFLFVIIILFWLQINAINAATEAACLILSVDETVKNPKVQLDLCCLRIKKYTFFAFHFVGVPFQVLLSSISKCIGF